MIYFHTKRIFVKTLNYNKFASLYQQYDLSVNILYRFHNKMYKIPRSYHLKTEIFRVGHCYVTLIFIH